MKKLISILLIVQLIILCPIVVNALSYTASLSTDVAELKAGETVSINMKLSNIDMDTGIMAMSAKLIFDENIFEPITVNTLGGIVSSSLSKMNGLNGWGSISYSPVTKIFAMDASSFMTDTDDVLQILLKVKSGVTAKKTTVEVRDIEASNGDKDVKADNVSIEIGREGGEENPNPPNPPDTGNNNIGNNTGNNIKNNTTSNTPSNSSNSNSSRNNVININSGNNNNKNNNKNNSSGTQVTNRYQSNNNSGSTINKGNQGSNDGSNLPYTGTTSTIVTMIIILIVVAFISYLRYNDMRNIK